MGHATGEEAFSAMVKIVDLYFEGNHWKTERKEMTWHDLYFKKSLQPLEIKEAAGDKKGARLWLYARGGECGLGSVSLVDELRSGRSGIISEARANHACHAFSFTYYTTVLSKQ